MEVGALIYKLGVIQAKLAELEVQDKAIISKIGKDRYKKINALMIKEAKLASQLHKAKTISGKLKLEAECDKVHKEIMEYCKIDV